MDLIDALKVKAVDDIMRDCQKKYVGQVGKAVRERIGRLKHDIKRVSKPGDNVPRAGSQAVMDKNVVGEQHSTEHIFFLKILETEKSAVQNGAHQLYLCQALLETLAEYHKVIGKGEEPIWVSTPAPHAATK